MKRRLTFISYTPAELAEFRKVGAQPVWDKWVADVEAPARATGEVAIMAPGYRVEIILTAAV